MLSFLLFSSVALAFPSVPTSPKDAIPSGAIAVPLIRESTFQAYLAGFEVGTPPQKEYVEIDSGSPTVSFENPKNNICSEPSKPCKEYGTFVNTSSTTCKYINSDFSDELIDFGTGDTLQDVLHIGGVAVPNFKFGYIDGYSFPDQVARPTKTICGLALSCAGEILNSSCYDDGFYLLPQLYNLGKINKRAVSIYMGPESPHVNNSEMILGGAYDQAKQGGKPFTVPMINNNGFSQTNSVNTTGISVTLGGNTTRLALTPANASLLDTGNPYLYMPNPIFSIVHKTFGSPKPNGPYADAGYNVSCKYRSLPATDKVTIEFGNSKTNIIDVPLSSLVIDFGNGKCGSDIQSNGPSSNGLGALGDPFLRNTYITFDDDDFTVTMAQAKFTNERKIVPFAK